jgi:hypothetical protein
MTNFESVDILHFIDTVRGTPLEACLNFWRGRRLAGQTPLKSAMDPVEMPRRILPSLFIYQQMEDGRFRCRLAGTEICRVFRHNPTGLYLDALVVPSAVSSRQRLFTEVLERGLPVVYGGRLMHTTESFVRFRRLLLPVSGTGERADHVFGMVVFYDFERVAHYPVRPHDGTPDFEAWATLDDLDNDPSQSLAACG